MRKILLLLLVFGLVTACAGVVSATEGDDATPPDNSWDTGQSLGENQPQGSAGGNEPPAPVIPTVSFTASPESGDAPLPVTFTSSSTNADSFEWNFGAGIANKTGSSTSHTFETKGTYPVTLTAKNTSSGKTATVTKEIIVREKKGPAPTITKIDPDSTSGLTPLTVNFTATASNNPTSYAWNFGDGTTGTGNPVTHTYTKLGTHTVNVTATNNNGTSEVMTARVIVNANTSAYKVAIDATPLNGTAPLKISFKLNTTIPDDDISTVNWDFGVDEDSFLSKSDPTYKAPSWTYNDDGTYTVTLTVKSKLSGTEYKAESKITVSDLVPSFTESTRSGPVPLEVKFTDTSKGPTAWLWNIYKIDGGSRTSVKEFSNQNITYTFDRAGKYEVELTAKKGTKSVTTYKEITVTEKAATTAATTKATTKATTVATTAATTQPVAKAAYLAGDDTIPNPMDLIDEFIRLFLAMLNPAKYNVEI